MIYDIQRYAIHDGTGIRTLIFYKGCPLSCKWCCNPESQAYTYSLMYDHKLCQDFGDCLKANSNAISKTDPCGIVIHRELLDSAEGLKNVCASKALRVAGEKQSPEELLLEIQKDLPFYKDTGGVTLSGGEPLAQGPELLQLLQLLRDEHISVHLETSLHVKWELVDRCIGLVDTFLADLKHVQKDKFRTHTGGDAALVMTNFQKLGKTRAHVIVRLPVIPGFNHSEPEICELIDFVVSLQTVREVHFLPYHNFGLEKYQMLGRDYELQGAAQVRDRELAPYIQYAESKGLLTKIGG